MAELLGEVLLRPRLVEGALDPRYVEREKENLISTIETSLNDKRVYAERQMLRAMCREDSFGIPRLGDAADVAAVTPEELYRHYRQTLGTSQVELFYAGGASPGGGGGAAAPGSEGAAWQTLEPLSLAPMGRRGGVQYLEETMDLTQGKLSMGFTTGITTRDAGFPALMVLNAVFGGGPHQQAVFACAGEAVPVLLCLLLRLWGEGHSHRVFRH